jgi:phosphoesterase RecJ-like protein
MANLDYKAAISAIESASNILILPSSPPDGDSIGCALAFFLAIKKVGKKATVVAADPVPDAYRFLPDSQSIESEYNFGRDFVVTVDVSKTGFKELNYEVKDQKVNIIITPQTGSLRPEDLLINQASNKFDLIITVDTAEVKQLGPVYEANQELFANVMTINIDHHPSNTNFAKLNLVDPEKAATTLMLTELFNQLSPGLIDADIATLLLAGIITDTGSFQNANTSPEAFDTAATLISLGARQQEIIHHIYKTKELHTLRLWGRVLSNIQTDYTYKLVWSAVTQKDFLETGSKESDIGDIIDELLSNAPEAEVVVLFKELANGVTHLSLRSTRDEVNVSVMAQHFGGGGHKRAAGANIKNPDFNAVVTEVLNYIRSEQQKRMVGSAASTEVAAASVPVVDTTETVVEAPAPTPDVVAESVLQPEVAQEEPTPQPVAAYELETPMTQPEPQPVVAPAATPAPAFIPEVESQVSTEETTAQQTQNTATADLDAYIKPDTDTPTITPDFGSFSSYLKNRTDL